MKILIYILAAVPVYIGFASAVDHLLGRNSRLDRFEELKELERRQNGEG